MYDLALSQHGDLVVAGNRDLAGISGSDLIDQRIRIRLTVRRGSWLYDDTDTFGSHIHSIISMPPENALTAVNGMVREALRDMEDVTVQDVDVDYRPDDRNITLFVKYETISEEGSAERDVRELQITLQGAAEAGG